ncbi:WD40 repeat-like protein [Hymenopellis radicata]|nr:WD40 repeat-like protein [Hymenopellis radicata]
MTDIQPATVANAAPVEDSHTGNAKHEEAVEPTEGADKQKFPDAASGSRATASQRGRPGESTRLTSLQDPVLGTKKTRDEGPEDKQSCGCKKDGRNLVVCIDGTSNQFGTKNSNVVEFYSLIKKEEANQRTWYNSGIGTYAKPSWKSLSYLRRTISHKIDMAIAWNFERIVCGAYRWLSDNYEPGDCIYLFGFSRGAYQVRVISAMIEKVGLIHKGNEMQIPFAYELYSREDDKDSVLCKNFKRSFSRKDVKVHFVGAWDTVSSVGVIRARKLLPGTTDGMEHVCYFRHALALDERRVKFLPEYANGGSMKHEALPAQVSRTQHGGWFARRRLFRRLMEPGPAQEPPTQPPPSHSITETPRQSKWTVDVKEVWFAGTHSDIGGGNAENTDMSRQVPPLRWMVSEAKKADLRMDEMRNELHSPKMVDIIESLTWPWWLLEVFPMKRLAYTDSVFHCSNVSFPSFDCSLLYKINRPHLGRGRTISYGQKLHLSVCLTPESWVPKANALDPAIWPMPSDTPLHPTTLRQQIGALLSAPNYPHYLEFNEYERARIMLLNLHFKGSDSNLKIQMHSESQSDPQWQEDLLSALIDLLLEPGSSEHLGSEILDAFNKELSPLRIRRRQINLGTASPLINKLLSGGNEKDEDTARQFLRGFTVPIIQTAYDVWCTVFSKDGKYIFHGSWDGHLRVSDAYTGEAVAQVPTTGDVFAIAFSSNGGRCVVGGWQGLVGGFVQVFNWSEEQRQLSEAGSDLFKDVIYRNSVGFLRNQDPNQEEDIVALQGEELFWNVGKNTVKLMEGYTSRVDHIAFSPQGDTMAAYSTRSREFQVWNAATRKCLFTLPVRGDDRHSCIACSINGELLAAGSLGGLIRIWDTKSGEESGQLRGNTYGIIMTSVCFSPDSKLLVSGSSDHTITVWDVATCKLLETFVGHENVVWSVAFSPDGKRIVSGSRDGTVRVWDIETITSSRYGRMDE